MNSKNIQEEERTTLWLVGCCASGRDVDDGEIGPRAPVEGLDMQICYDQPQPVPQLRAEPNNPRPSTSHSMSEQVSQWVSNSRDYVTRASSRASIATLARPRQSYSRPSISCPTEFRHFDGPEGIQNMLDEAPMPVRRRGSFRPLELSIYMPNGRLSPLPDFEEAEFGSDGSVELGIPAEALVRVRDSRTNSLSSSPSTSSYVFQRKSLASPSRRSSLQSQKSTSTHERHLSGTTMKTMATPTFPLLVEEPKSSSNSVREKLTIQRSLTSGTLSPARVLSRLPSPSRSRANTAPSRPSSLRRTRTDVDDAIRELNTIVEERRASAYRSHSQSPALINRPPPSPSHHVPYIAPAMRMHVRSETLSDIGSAFSAPLARQTQTTGPSTSLSPPPRPSTLKFIASPRSLTGPLTSNPITPPPPRDPPSRLTAWLKCSASTLTSPPAPNPAPSSFYNCTSQPGLGLSCRPTTPVHTRHDSQDSDGTATVTLFSSTSSMSRPSTRSASPVSSVATTSPKRRLRRVPEPLTLVLDKDIAVDAAVLSAGSEMDLDAGVGEVERDRGARYEMGAVGVAF